MTQREATAWALYVSEIWYSLLDLPKYKKRRTYYKARGIVLHDRALNHLINGENRHDADSQPPTVYPCNAGPSLF